jgi:demethylmenaquinone methyltransferase / 2-methoxy-6-polyprenyl-1,4-benzoquinol methylase
VLFAAHTGRHITLKAQDMIDKKRPDWNASLQQMFSSISKRYDLLNTLMSLGQDRRWRKSFFELAQIPSRGTLLDVGAGTGEIALEAKRTCPGLKVAALDLTPGMMRVGREKESGHEVLWVQGDALNLPFPDESFDVVTSGYLIRNVPDVAQAFREQLRVVKKGGRVVCLDTCPPSNHLLRPLIGMYFKTAIPLMGGLVSGQWKAYRYLPASIQAFKTPGEISSIMESSGLTGIVSRKFMFDTVAILMGTRPEV